MPRLTKILFRRDTAANWSSTNPTLDSGEAGFDTTNKVLKMGDGTTAWNSLGYFSPMSPLWWDFISGVYYMTPTTLTTTAPNQAQTQYTPFLVTKTTTFDRIACVTGGTFSGTATVRLGIYNHDASTWKPSTVVLDAGTVSCTAASTGYEITISQQLTPGIYWLAMNTQTAATTNNFYATNSSGASQINGGSGTAGGVTSVMGYWENSITGAFATAGSLTRAGIVGITKLRAQ